MLMLRLHILSYPGWQCAAVRTCLSEIRTPPHLFFVNNPSHVDSLTRTCQGQSPNLLSDPPTIRALSLRGRTPQSEKVKPRCLKDLLKLGLVYGVHFCFGSRSALDGRNNAKIPLDRTEACLPDLNKKDVLQAKANSK